MAAITHTRIGRRIDERSDFHGEADQEKDQGVGHACDVVPEVLQVACNRRGDLCLPPSSDQDSGSHNGHDAAELEVVLRHIEGEVRKDRCDGDLEKRIVTTRPRTRPVRAASTPPTSRPPKKTAPNSSAPVRSVLIENVPAAMTPRMILDSTMAVASLNRLSPSTRTVRRLGAPS